MALDALNKLFDVGHFLYGRFKIDLALYNTDQNQTTQTTQHLLWSYSIYCDRQTEDSRLILKDRVLKTDPAADDKIVVKTFRYSISHRTLYTCTFLQKIFRPHFPTPEIF
jgi:hypothetical protein